MSEKPLEMRRFQVIGYPEQPDVAPFWAAALARDGKDEENGMQRRRLDV
jgi:hypothetical protein